MKADFWLQRWRENQIGFHESATHPLLARHWPVLHSPTPQRAFVPLCGKSLDMVWLSQRGLDVIGCELSPVAVRDFFAAAGIEASRREVGTLPAVEGGGYQLFEGDFFALTRAEVDPFDAVYDRAALIALPPDMRQRYAEHLTHLADAGTRMLLIGVEYPEHAVNPPPFAVTGAEIESLYADHWRIETLETAAADVKGTQGEETAYLLTRTADHARR